MFLKKPLFVFVILVTCFCGAQAPVAPETNNKNKVEDLLVWKIAEDLKLSVKEEKALGEVIKILSAKKAKINSRIEESIQHMSKAAEKEKNKILQEYKKELKQLNDVSLEEIDKVQKILGPEKTAQYLVVKSEVVSRIRSLMGAQDKPESTVKSDKSDKSLPEPKLIEE